jgi:hypothetical protein
MVDVSGEAIEDKAAQDAHSPDAAIAPRARRPARAADLT